MARIVLENVTKRWGNFYAVDHLNLTIEDNAFVTLLGPSGCGKTTILRMIAGLETPTEGRITIDDLPVFDSEQGVNIPPNRRRVGFLFQSYALWPNMTVYQNIAFGLENVKESMSVVDDEAENLTQWIALLSAPDELLRVVAGAGWGGAEEKKLRLQLADWFDLSNSAAGLFLSRLGAKEDARAEAAKLLEEFRAKLAENACGHKERGTELNERFEVTQDGAVQNRVRRLSRDEIDRRVRRVARVVKIGPFMDRYPSELSGGQQQRVAIARTLAPDPKVLFMDEPLSNLDAKLRMEMRSELQRLHLNTGSTFIYVTHDQMEAMTLATRICLMNDGVLQQYEAPLELYNRPANLFAADFVGSPAINFIEARGEEEGDGLALTLFDDVPARFAPESPLSRPRIEGAATPFRYTVARVEEVLEEGGAPEFVLGVRPEFVRISSDGALEGEVFSSMPTGMETTVRLRYGNYLLTAVIFGGVSYSLGERVRFDFPAPSALLFDRTSGRLLARGAVKL